MTIANTNHRTDMQVGGAQELIVLITQLAILIDLKSREYDIKPSRCAFVSFYGYTQELNITLFVGTKKHIWVINTERPNIRFCQNLERYLNEELAKIKYLGGTD